MLHGTDQCGNLGPGERRNRSFTLEMAPCSTPQIGPSERRDLYKQKHVANTMGDSDFMNQIMSQSSLFI